MMKLSPSPTKLWCRKGSKPVQLVNGSHKRLCFFGAVSDEHRHCCTARRINSDSFIKFADYLVRRYSKVVLIVDHGCHHKSAKVKRFLKKLKGSLLLWFLPKRLPELNPQEQAWRSCRKNVTYKLFDTAKALGWAVKSHIRWDFNINLFKFWS